MAIRSLDRRGPALLALLAEAYPVPDPMHSDDHHDRYYHEDVYGMDSAERARELTFCRMLVLLGGDPWYEVREAALTRSRGGR